MHLYVNIIIYYLFKYQRSPSRWSV